MASRALILSANQFTTGALSANSEAAGLGVANLADPRGSPSYAWQSVAGVMTLAAGALIRCDFAQPAQTIHVLGVARTNLTPGATVYLSAWVAAGPTQVYSAVLPGPPATFGQVIHAIPAGVVCDFVQIWFDDPNNPDGSINVPLAIAGAAWNPGVGLSMDSAEGLDAVVRETTTDGGQEFPDLRSSARRYEVRMQGVSAAERWGALHPIAAASVLGGNILIVPDYSSANINKEAVFGRLTLTADVSYSASDFRAVAGRIRERV